jgi:hypothetical protein
MPKGSLLSDTFEQLAELGASTAKQSGTAVASTFSPLKMLEQVVGGQPTKSQDKGMEKLEKGQSQAKNNTKLDFTKLQEKYGQQDTQKTARLRNRLFQLVKGGEEKAIAEEKKKKEEKRREETSEEQEKRRKEAEKRHQEQSADIPHGKERRSIFSHKKMAARQQTEVKPASGKQ